MVDFELEGSKKAAPKIGAIHMVVVTDIIAVIGIACYLAGVGIGAAIFGGLGLVMGGYSMGFVHKHAESNVKLLLGLSGAALLISVIAFMMGFMAILD
ncbi:MAG: hypothetical protein MJZ21_03750 [archaeon]|nr:hypothetical protein [archaeon]